MAINNHLLLVIINDNNNLNLLNLVYNPTTFKVIKNTKNNSGYRDIINQF